ncbi:MAG TPA: hypothetical protein VMT96_00660 [Candidatus Bathyarchaeia archaeon]|nr:hypothetical protein [Candidatus Bathyarchaeia archaeon]
MSFYYEARSRLTFVEGLSIFAAIAVPVIVGAMHEPQLAWLALIPVFALIRQNMSRREKQRIATDVVKEAWQVRRDFPWDYLLYYQEAREELSVNDAKEYISLLPPIR